MHRIRIQRIDEVVGKHPQIVLRLSLILSPQAGHDKIMEDAVRIETEVKVCHIKNSPPERGALDEMENTRVFQAHLRGEDSLLARLCNTILSKMQRSC
jgi:hypothetical protein